MTIRLLKHSGILATATVLLVLSCSEKDNGFFTKKDEVVIDMQTNSGMVGQGQLAKVVGEDKGALKAVLGASDTMQVVQASSSSDISGTAMSIPPGALAVGTEITIEEASTIASNTVTQELGLAEAPTISAATKAVAITADQVVSSGQPLTIMIALNAGAGLNLTGETESNFDNLIVVYKTKAADGTLKLGIILRSELEIIDGSVAFATSNFGVFQAATTSVPVTKAVEKTTEVPIMTKIQAEELPPLVWELGAPKAGADRSVDLSAKVKGFKDLQRCALVADYDKAAPFDFHVDLGAALSGHFSAVSEEAHTVHFSFNCLDQGGREGSSTWISFDFAKVIPPDLVPPNPSIVSGPALGKIARPTFSWVSGGADGAGIFRFKLDNGAYSKEGTAKKFQPATNLSDGAHSFAVQERDLAGNWSQEVVFPFIIDTVAPSMAFNINGNALFTQVPYANLMIEAGAASDITEVRIAIGAAGCATAPFIPVASLVAPVIHALPAPDGQKVVCLQAKDAAGNLSAVVTRSIKLDSAQPTSTISISTPTTISASWTSGSLTTFTGTASDADSGVASVQVSVQKDGDAASCLNAGKTAFSENCPNYIPATFSSGAWSLSINDSVFYSGSVYTIRSAATDAAGHLQGTPTTAPPVTWGGSALSTGFSIINGANIAISPNVTLHLSNYSGVTHFRVANETSASSLAWVGLDPNWHGVIGYTLTPGDGLKTIFFQAKDANGNISTEVLDTIILDTTEPDSTFSPLTYLGPNSTAGGQTDILGTAYDINGINSVEVSLEKINSGMCLNSAKTAFTESCPHFVPVSGTTSFTFSLADSVLVDGPYQMHSRAFDLAGHTEGTWGYGSFNWISSAPNSTFTINSSNPAYTNYQNADLYLANPASVAFYRTADGTNCSGASWQTFNTHPIPKQLSNGDGSKTVCLEVKDQAANVSSTSTDSIHLDTTLPSSTSSLSGTIGPGTYGGPNTNISGTASDSGSGLNLVQISIKKDNDPNTCLDVSMSGFNASCSTSWITVSGTTSWSMLLSDSSLAHGSTYQIFSRAFDVSGLMQTSFGSSSFTWASNPPNPNFLINGGAAATASTNVDLNFINENGIAQYRRANGSDCSAATWANYSGGALSFTLPGGEGTKIICMEVRDSLGNESSTTSSIALDTTPPNQPYFTAPASPVATPNAMPTWSWYTGGGGNGTYRYKLNDGNLTSGATETSGSSFTPGSALSSGEHILYLQERDGAGNWSSVRSYTYFVDAIAPSVGSYINRTNITANALTLTWGTGSDNMTPNGSLKYSAYFSSSTLSTVGQVLGSATQVLGPSYGATTVNVNGLSSSTTYYFYVIIEDEVGNTSLYSPVTEATSAFNCDSGDTTNHCYISSTKTIPSDTSLTISGDLTIQSGGVLTVSTQTGTINTLSVGGTLTVQGVIDANIQNLSANIVTVASTGLITANFRGYPANTGPAAGSSPGGVSGGGGGHAGQGGNGASSGGAGGSGIYGQADQPTTHGSGGGSGDSGTAGSGGGIIKIVAATSLNVIGHIKAMGQPGTVNSGGGAGGSIWLNAPNFTGNGSISVQGGSGGPGGGGAGGGGRLAFYGVNRFVGGLLLEAGMPGTGSGLAGTGDYYQFTNSNFCNTGDPSNDCTVNGNLTFGWNEGLMIGGNFYLSGQIRKFPEYGPPLAINVGGDMQIQSSGAILSSLDLQARTLTIASNGLIDASGTGPKSGGVGAGSNGPNGSASGNGGAHGGSGGMGYGNTGPASPHGDQHYPTALGGAGGAGAMGAAQGGAGGGRIKIALLAGMSNSGIIRANGFNGLSSGSYGGGGGAGGSIWIFADSISNTGTIEARGGNGAGSNMGGGGSGGRIATHIRNGTYPSVSVPGGTGNTAGSAGTATTNGNFRRIFVTAETHAANFGGASSADSICSNLAGNRGMSAVIWKALLTSSNESFGSRYTGNSAAPVYNLMGQKVALDNNGLFSSGTAHFSGVTFNEFIRPENGMEVWTGMYADGSPTSANCQNWTSTASSGDWGTIGISSGAAANEWTNHSWPTCNIMARLYCISY